jgi:hypothetical protein
VSLSRSQLQLIRWSSAAATGGIIIASWIWNPHGGWAVLCFFGFLIVGAPAALITLYLMNPKARVNR